MYRYMAKMCIPTIISLLFVGMYSVIDGLFVGQVTKDVGLAAINIAWPITALIMACGIGIGTGCSVNYSHQKGKGNDKECREMLKTGLTTLIICGAVLMVVLLLTYQDALSLLGAKGNVYVEAERYSKIIIYGCVFQVIGAGLIPLLRSLDKPIEAMVSMIIGMVANISINYYLIVVKRLGIQGAAYGTMVSQGMVSLISMIIIVRQLGFFPGFSLHLGRMKQIVKRGISAFGLSLAPSFVLMITNMQCLAYGGDEAVSCYAVISYIVFPVCSMLNGIGDGSQSVFSYYHGASDYEKIAEAKKIAYQFILGLECILFLLVFVSREYYPIWFGISQKAASYFDVGMIISMMSFLFVGFTKFGIAYLNAILRMKESMLLIYGESLCVSPLLLFILPRCFGINGIWLSLPVTSMIMLALYLVLEQRIRRKNDFVA